MSFQDLKKEVQAGLDGRNQGIPMGFNRLNRYIGIRKSIYTLIGGLTGSGKTSFVDDAYVLNPFDWYISKENNTNVKLEIVYRSMERGRTYKLAKWIGRKIFLDHGVIITVNKLLGWKEKMTKDEHDLFLMYEDYMGEMSEVMTIVDGPENAVGIAKELKAHALQRGRIEQVDEYNKVYIPNDENTITIVVIDHIGLLKTTQAQTTKKQAIDKMSDELRYARDFYGYTPVVVSQFNRDISNPIRIKNGDVEPQLEDFAESSQTQNDADVVLALFDPMRYKVADPSGYDLNKLRDEFGAKYFRSLRLIKNSYGEDDVRVGLGFLGQVGMFKELPRKKDILDNDYYDVVNKTFFLNK
jgi:replicative DNA helicase